MRAAHDELLHLLELVYPEDAQRVPAVGGQHTLLAVSFLFLDTIRNVIEMVCFDDAQRPCSRGKKQRAGGASIHLKRR